jgi:thiol:disulfide interchange protein DsbD
MVWVRKIFGFILLAMALYFVRHLVPARLITIGYALIAIVGGIYLGWIDRSIGAGKGFKMIKRAIGIAGFALGVALLVVPALRGDAVEKARGIAWLPFNEAAVAQAARDGRPVVIDFTGAWCVPCHELDKKTFSDPEVMKIAERLITLRVDLTKSGAAETKTKNDYGVRGVPTIVFIDKTGLEIKGLRATGFIEASEFRKRLETLTGGRVER